MLCVLYSGAVCYVYYTVGAVWIYWLQQSKTKQYIYIYEQQLYQLSVVVFFSIDWTFISARSTLLILILQIPENIILTWHIIWRIKHNKVHSMIMNTLKNVCGLWNKMLKLPCKINNKKKDNRNLNTISLRL